MYPPESDTTYRAIREELENGSVAYYVLRELTERIDGREIDRIVDVGGDKGIHLALYRKHIRAKEAISIDVRLPAEEIEGIRYVKSTAEDLLSHIERSSVDIVLLIEVLEHLKDPDAAISQIREILKPNGILVITTPNLSSALNRLALLVGLQPLDSEVSTKHVFGRPGNRVVGHLHLFTYRSLREFITYYGFEILRNYTLRMDASLLENHQGWKFRALAVFEALLCRITSRLGSRTVMVARPKHSNS